MEPYWIISSIKLPLLIGQRVTPILSLPPPRLTKWGSSVSNLSAEPSSVTASARSWERDTRQPDFTAIVKNSDTAGLFELKFFQPVPLQYITTTSQAKGLGDGPSLSHSSKRWNFWNS